MNICAALRYRANGKQTKRAKRTLLEFSEEKLIANQKSKPIKPEFQKYS